jgi:hypothetical protein
MGEISKAIWRNGWWLAGGTALIWLLLMGLYWEFVFDDAYIIFRHARHFAKGIGLVYNPTTVVDGYTSFLWTVLIGCSVFIFSERNIILITKLMSGALSLLALVCIYHILRYAPIELSPRWMAVALSVVSPAVVISTADGLETPLYTAIQMMLVLQWLKDLKRGSPSPMLGVWFALLTLTRPDGILLIALAMVVFLKFSGDMRRFLKQSLPFVVIWSAIYIPYFIWHLFYYGHPFPNTFYAKMGGHQDLLVRGVNRIIQWQQELGSIVSIAFVLYAIIKISSPYTSVLVAVMVSRILLVLWSGGEVMGHHRFMAPAVPAYWLLFQLGFSLWLARLQSQRGWMRHSIGALPSVLFIALLTISLIHVPKYQQYAKGLNEAHIRLGHWIRQNTRPETVIAVGDAGAIPYHADRHAIDFGGLNDPHLAHLPGQLGHKKIDVNYILSQKPDLIILGSQFPPPLPFKGLATIDQALYDTIAQKRNYTLHSVYQFNERYFLWVLVHKESNCWIHNNERGD